MVAGVWTGVGFSN